jgi:hypothetical protein
MPFALSVLDLSPIPSGSKDSEALWNTLDLAQLADELGYHRYWLAEHHGIENFVARTQADEIIISTMIHDHRKRRRSYELIPGRLH